MEEYIVYMNRNPHFSNKPKCEMRRTPDFSQAKATIICAGRYLDIYNALEYEPDEKLWYTIEKDGEVIYTSSVYAG